MEAAAANGLSVSAAHIGLATAPLTVKNDAGVGEMRADLGHTPALRRNRIRSYLFRYIRRVTRAPTIL
jgi:hypothetical protein